MSAGPTPSAAIALPPLPAPSLTIPMGWTRPGTDVYAAAEIEAYAREAIQADRAGRALVAGWQPIATAPQTGRTLLLGYFNVLGNWRTLRGQWFSDAVIQYEWTNSGVHEAGWFETSVECDDEDNGCWSTDPTHWMPLPEAPSATPAASPAASPADMVLVPREPTRDMLDAGAQTPAMLAIGNASTITQLRSGVSLPPETFKDGPAMLQAYRAMIAAAPKLAATAQPAAPLDHLQVLSHIGTARESINDAADEPAKMRRELLAGAMRALDKAVSILAQPSQPSQPAAPTEHPDTKRMDWIESKVCDVSRLGDSARTLRISWNNGANSTFVGPSYSTTWREAIDAEMPLDQPPQPETGERDV